MGRNAVYKTDQTKEQIAYLAGIIDGEGCFYFGRVKQGKYGNGWQWHSNIQVSNCDEALIIWLEDIFGGKKETRYRTTSKNKYNRPVFIWRAGGEMINYLLPLIEPYLVIKKKHCVVMAQIRATYKNWGSKQLPPEVSELRFTLLKELRNLNSRWHDHPLKNPSPLSP